MEGDSFGNSEAGTSKSALISQTAKSKIRLINPETGKFSPTPKEDESFFEDDDNSNSSEFPDQIELKPDPLLMDTQRLKRKRSFNDMPDYDPNNSEDYSMEDLQDGNRRRGGRSRDPVWNEFHSIGGHAWQCNDCHYSLTRPQADRMRKHRRQCQGGGDTNGIASDNSAAVAGSPSKSPTTPTSNLIPGLTQFKTNSITKELKRIADALEESVKLKKLKLGLDPHVPFDGKK